MFNLEKYPFTDKYLTGSKGYLIWFGALFQIVQIGMRAWGDSKRNQIDLSKFNRTGTDFDDVIRDRDRERDRDRGRHR